MVTSVFSHFGPFFEDRNDQGPKWPRTELAPSLRSWGPNCTSKGPIYTCTSANRHRIQDACASTAL